MSPPRTCSSGKPAWLLPACALLAALPVPGESAAPPARLPPRPAVSRPDEPRAAALSLGRAGEFLDAATLH